MTVLVIKEGASWRKKQLKAKPTDEEGPRKSIPGWCEGPELGCGGEGRPRESGMRGGERRGRAGGARKTRGSRDVDLKETHQLHRHGKGP